MCRDYIPIKKMKVSDLFDGRLEEYGICEFRHAPDDGRSERRGVKTRPIRPLGNENRWRT
jgi:hypothetical protein